MKLIFRIFIVVLLVALFASCGRDTVYHSYRPVSNDGWQREDTLLFALPSSIPGGDYDVEIGLRHHEDYPYRDLWLAYGFASDVSKSLADSVQLTLAYESGNWHGNGAAGLYQYSSLSPRPIHLMDERTDSVLRIVHLMKDEPLKGICDVGIRLIKR